MANENERSDALVLGTPLVLAPAIIEKLSTLCKILRQSDALRSQGFQTPASALLYGPPGNGLEEIARVIANEIGVHFLKTGPSDFKAEHIGQSAQKVHELFQKLRAMAPCVLFINEIDSVAAKWGSPGADQFTKETVTQLLIELDGVKNRELFVFFLAATNHPERVDEAIFCRFVEKIEITNPDAQLRERLFQLGLACRSVDFDVDEVSKELASRVGSLSRRDIGSIVKQAYQLASDRALKSGVADREILTRDDLLSQMPAAKPEP